MDLEDGIHRIHDHTLLLLHHEPGWVYEKSKKILSTEPIPHRKKKWELFHGHTHYSHLWKIGDLFHPCYAIVFIFENSYRKEIYRKTILRWITESSFTIYGWFPSKHHLLHFRHSRYIENVFTTTWLQDHAFLSSPIFAPKRYDMVFKVKEILFLPIKINEGID